MPNARVVDNEGNVDYISYDEDSSTSSSPMKPVESGNGEIFVTIPTLRDGDRCASTIKALYDNAKDPSKVFVGIVEQNEPKDVKCMVKYCELHGVTIRPKYPNGPMTKKCPYYSQIRYLAVFNLGAKGPTYARSLMRRLIGDEEFCLQIDAHSDFASNWDELLVQEWHATENEYGIISTIPPGFSEKKNNVKEIRRMCKMSKHSQGFFIYKKPLDHKAFDLSKPLLSHSWCAGFSFSKCHLEITTPYDVFIPQVFDAEEFTRFVRLWTRGYDVYTPTRNIVYHNYNDNPNAESKDWPTNNKERLDSLKRVSTLLMLPSGEGKEAHADLGLYGLGKRRSLADLMEFSGFSFDKEITNNNCALHSRVEYDLSISPFDNMYTNAKDMDPQPEYPLRHALTAPFLQSVEDLNNIDLKQETKDSEDDSIPLKTLLVFWMIGLFIWYKTFVPAKRLGKAHFSRKGDFKKV